MADFVHVPLDRVPASSLQALLEEYASRDGTDYGMQEISLEQKVQELKSGLSRGVMVLVFDTSSEALDILSAESARDLGVEAVTSVREELEQTPVLDTCGLRCPEPVMLLHKAMADLGAGEVLRVLATDPTTRQDIPKFCHFLNHELLSEAQDGDVIVYELRKGV